MLPLGTFKAVASDEKRTKPSGQREAAKEAPYKGLAFRMNARRQCEEAARHKWTNAASQSRQRLCNAIKSAQTGMRGSRVCNLLKR